MARNDPQVNIRLPADLKQRVEAAALRNQRSFKAEIVHALEESYPEPPPLDERLGDLLVTLGTLAGQAEGETPEGILGEFTASLVETLTGIDQGMWPTDERTRRIASEALRRMRSAKP